MIEDDIVINSTLVPQSLEWNMLKSL